MTGRPRPLAVLAAGLGALVLTVTAAAVIGHPAAAPRKPVTRSSSRVASPLSRQAAASRVSVRPHINLAGLRWARFHGMQLPESRAAGPRGRRRGLAYGYADTPLGAVLAAVNIAVRATPQFGPGIFASTITRQVIGPDAAALLRSCSVAYRRAAAAAHVRNGRPLGPAFVVEQGFRVVSWSPAQATVDIASAGPGPQGVTARAATRVEVEWARGDWRLLAPAVGNWAASATVLRSLAGFTLFPLPSGG